MPYIVGKRRRELSLKGDIPSTSGELNYLITQLVITYLQSGSGLSYTRFNDVVGALECAKLEAYRRVAAPYEDTKIDANTDVYPESLLSLGEEDVKPVEGFKK